MPSPVLLHSRQLEHAQAQVPEDLKHGHRHIHSGDPPAGYDPPTGPGSSAPWVLHALLPRKHKHDSELLLISNRFWLI